MQRFNASIFQRDISPNLSKSFFIFFVLFLTASALLADQSFNMNLAPVMQKEDRTHLSETAPRRKASTLDILGRGTTRIRIKPVWREHYNRLRDLREQMLDSRRALASDAKEEKSNYSIHMADAASDTYDSDWALSLLSSDQNAIYEIEEAINRIETGVYGTCEMTGQPIEPERLEAIPWTRFAMEAQQQLEDQGAVYKIRLADRRGLSEAEEPAEAADEEEGS
jgi:RNA polymerase-binding transcription factor DksA